MQETQSRFAVWWAIFLDVFPVLVVLAIILAAVFATGAGSDSGGGHWPLG